MKLPWPSGRILGNRAQLFIRLKIFQVVKGFRNRLTLYPEMGALIAFLFVFFGFAVVAENFLSLSTMSGILTIIAELGIITTAVALLMISGEFDLSVGSILAFSSLTFAFLLRAGLADFLALFLALGLSAFFGLINGVIVVYAGIPSFIATLGTMMFWRGILLAITGGLPTIPYLNESFLLMVLNSRIIQDFRTSAIWFALIVFFAHFLLRHTPYGNWVYATGGSKEAARALGAPVAKVKLVNFIFSGFSAGLAGLIQFARFRTVDALRGQGIELEAIAAAVTGGLLLSGGYGSISGAIIGVFIVGMVRTGLLLAEAPPYWYQAFIGLILIMAVIINVKLKQSR